MELNCELQGADALMRSLKGLSKAAGKRAFRKGLRAASKVQLPAIQKRTPVRKGKLKRALKVRAMKRSRTALGTHVASVAPKGESYYGAFNHWGTKRGIEANPWITEGAEASEKPAIRELFRVTAQAIQQELAK